ncbi:MAG: hypothetical protein ACQERC_03780 [Bacteroidota bacterium]
MKIDKDKINRLSPEDALPLFIRIKYFLFGKKKPDGFTRIAFTISLFIWVLLTLWNAISYFVLLTSDVIEANKGFSVQAIIRENGVSHGFSGQEFLDALHHFYFINNFIWLLVFVGLVLMYRKKRTYPLFIFVGMAIHFVYMFWYLGFQYFVEDISFFDKICYAIFIFLIIIHSWLMNKEKGEQEPLHQDPQ